MRRILLVIPLALALSLAGFALAAPASAGGGIRMGATVPLTFSGQYLTEGATYDVVANGYVVTAKVGYYHVPGVSKSASGPAGQPDTPCLAEFQNAINGMCTVVGANFGELVGVIVDDAGTLLATVEIGDAPQFTAPATGWLFLAANDLNLTYFDNNGQFEVWITAE